jgi:ATP-binding cassette subfamily F protein 3
MALRKVERLNELDLEKKEKVEIKESKKPLTPQAPIANEIEKKTNEAEQKQIKSQIKKAEENISALEVKIKECDDKLANADEYQKLMNDKTFFDNYEKLKKGLESEMEKWEELSEKLL